MIIPEKKTKWKILSLWWAIFSFEFCQLTFNSFSKVISLSWMTCGVSCWHNLCVRRPFCTCCVSSSLSVFLFCSNRSWTSDCALLTTFSVVALSSWFSKFLLIHLSYLSHLSSWLKPQWLKLSSRHPWRYMLSQICYCYSHLTTQLFNLYFSKDLTLEIAL